MNLKEMCSVDTHKQKPNGNWFEDLIVKHHFGDLSQTAITSLPSEGLSLLEELILEDTPSLKVFPSVYGFGGLRVARLTYPHHCCSFQFPQQHDASRDDVNKKLVQNKECPDLQNRSPNARDTRSPHDDPGHRHSPSLDARGLSGQFRRNPQSGTFTQVDLDAHYRSKFLGPGSLSAKDRHVDPSSGALEISPHRLGLDHADPSASHLGEMRVVHSESDGGGPLDKDGRPRVSFTGGFRENGENRQELEWHLSPFRGGGGDRPSFPLGSGPINVTDDQVLPAFASPFPSGGGFHDPPSPFHPVGSFPTFSERRDDLQGSHPSGFPEDYSFQQDGEDLGHGTFHAVEVPVRNLTQEFRCGQFVQPALSVKCTPEPNAFNPCEDIMGNRVLRVAVWVVVVKAVFGNTAVIVVLSSTRFRMTVSKFLILNLAAADLMMGVYLLLIASMDLHTISHYFNYAIDWQNGPGCRMAGFFSVFSSELSIFSLTVITIERWYAITYAIHLNKRLKLLMAVKIMLIGWLYSLFMASLPLLGVSDYGKTSICLPMDAHSGAAVGYLAALLCFNTLAFVAISGCYVSMYCSIQSHNPITARSDLTVAKRMALLVFTDFACWAPIAFFAVTALAGVHFIDVTRAKVLLVFFYPLNSCANPYLYALMTKQYRRDLLLMLEARGFCTETARRYRSGVSSANNSLHHMTTSPGQHHRSSTLTQVTMCDAHKLHRGSCPSQCHNGGAQAMDITCTLPSPDTVSATVDTTSTERLAALNEYPQFMTDRSVSTNSARSHAENSSNEAPAPADLSKSSVPVLSPLLVSRSDIEQPIAIKSPIVTSPSTFTISIDTIPPAGRKDDTYLKNNCSLLKMDSAPRNSLSASTISSSISLSPEKKQDDREQPNSISRTRDLNGDEEDASDDGGDYYDETPLKFGKFKPILSLRGDDFELHMIDSSTSSSDFEDEVEIELDTKRIRLQEGRILDAEIQKDLKVSDPVSRKSCGKKYEKLLPFQAEVNSSRPTSNKPDTVNYIRAKVTSSRADSFLLEKGESYV